MIYYFLSSFIITIILQKLFIDKVSKTDFFKKKETVDAIKKTCIKELHKHKMNIPTMGGITMCMSLLIFTVVYYFVSGKMLWINILILFYGVMGFVDDYIKIKKMRDGVSRSEKMIGLTIISIFIVIMSQGVSLPMGILFVIMMVASCNSVNLTDGLDGLALGISSIVFLFIGIVAYQKNNEEVLLTALILIGTCIATLIFNFYPAKIFMGDTGSLMLGGAIAVLLIELGIPFWIFLVLAVCIWETISVIIQLSSIKLFNKKVFKIAPFHHHLEKNGMKELHIVYLFWIITVLLCVTAYIGVTII